MAYDPQLLSRVLAAPHPASNSDDELDEGDARQAVLLAKLERMVQHLPNDEQLAIRCLARGMSQTAIAAVLQVRQPSVFYRLTRALARLRWMSQCGFAELSPTLITRDLAGVPELRPADVELLASWHETRCQRVTAEALGRPHSYVRRRISYCVQVLAGHPELARYHRVYAALLASPQILRSWVSPRRAAHLSIAARRDDEHAQQAHA